MTKFDEMFADYILNQSQFNPDVFTVKLPNDFQVEIRGPQVPYSQEVSWEDVYPDPKNIRKNHDQSPESEPTDTKEDIAELSEDTVKQIYEMLGVEPPMPIKQGAEHLEESIRFGSHTKEYLQKANADANAILNLLQKLGYTDVPIRPILELIGIVP